MPKLEYASPQRACQAKLVCVHCQKEMTTRIDSDCCGAATCGSCLTICAAGFIPGACCFLWLGCQFIPFCCPCCRDKVHHCPHCDVVVGKKPVLGKSS